MAQKGSGHCVIVPDCGQLWIPSGMEPTARVNTGQSNQGRAGPGLNSKREGPMAAAQPDIISDILKPIARQTA